MGNHKKKYGDQPEKYNAKKQAVWTETQNIGKHAKSVERPDSFYDQAPTWSFSKCDYLHSKWGVEANAKILPKIIIRLATWEGQTWQEILCDTSGRRNNTKNHPIPAYKLIKEAQHRLEEINLDDFDGLYSLTIDGGVRIWGVIIEGVFCLVWIDPNHGIYPIKKRHT